jgi:hypothetical protein
MPPPLLITLHQQSQQYQFESTQLIRLVEQLLVEVETNIHSLVHSAPETDNAPSLKSLLSHTPLLSQIKELNEQFRGLGDLQTALNECVMDMAKREDEITKRELELAKTEISTLKQQDEMLMQLTKKEIEFAEKQAEFAEKQAQFADKRVELMKKEHEIKLKNKLLSQKELQLLGKEAVTEKKGYNDSAQPQNFAIAPFETFSNLTDQLTLVDDFHKYDIVEADSPNNYPLSPVFHHNNIRSLATCFNNYKDRKIARLNFSMGRLVRSTFKELQDQSTQLHDKSTQLHDKSTQLRINQDKLHTSQKKIKQQQTALNKREQAIVEREKILNHWMDAQLKPTMGCLSHNVKTCEDVEVGKDEKDQTESKLDVLWKITNLNKQISLGSVISNCKESLLALLYKTGTFFPILEYFFKND